MKKLLNKKGFTLMEMLIVVAIIVILVAVSMPVFSKQLTKAKEATDEANMRAAKAVATAEYLNNSTTFPAGTKHYYDAVNGCLVLAANKAGIEKYGKTTGDYSGVENGIIGVTVNATTGVVTVEWE